MSFLRIFSGEQWILMCLLFAAAVCDLKSYKIPNILPATGCILGFLIRGPSFLYGFFPALAVGFLLFVFRMVGAGDIKLLAVICGMLGPASGLEAAGLSFLFAAVASLLVMKIRKNTMARLAYFAAYFRQIFLTGKMEKYYVADRDGHGMTIHLAVYLFFGTLVLFLWKGGLV